MTMSKWIPASKPPKKAGKYIVTMRCLNRDFVDIANYSKDLYKVDADDFADKKGVAGWYGLDLEYGFYECEFVTAWQDAPEPYKAEREEQTE